MTFPSGASGFQNPILGGDGKLLRTSMRSVNFVDGSTGWAIFANGNVQFYNGIFRGTVSVGTGPKKLVINPAIPDIEFNPDTTKFDRDGVIDMSASTATRAAVSIISPYNNATADSPASINVYGSGGGTPTLVTIASDDTITSGPIHSTWNGKGRQTANVGPVLAGAVANIVSAIVVVPANSFQSDFKITCTWSGVTPSGAVTDTLYNMRILRDGVVLGSVRTVGPPHTQNDGGRTIVMTDIGVLPGNHTYTLSLSHEAASTATDLTVNCTPTAPAIILVEGC